MGGGGKGRCEAKSVGWPGISPRVGDSPPGLWDPPGSPLIRVLPGAPWLTPLGKRPRRSLPFREDWYGGGRGQGIARGNARRDRTLPSPG